MDSYRGRSTEAPMDFQFTSRPSTTPAWATPDRKRNHDQVAAASSAFQSTPRAPAFGSNLNVPFIFQAPNIEPAAQPWTPPPKFNAAQAFRQEVDIPEVTMKDASPVSAPKPEDRRREERVGRPVASGALRRVYNSRQRRAREARAANEAIDDSEGEDESPEKAAPLPRRTSTHYTLNMPAAAPPRVELSHTLHGYLQFAFNLALTGIVVYLIFLVLISLQRDVEHRIAEYSLDTIQEIGLCAAQFKANCGHLMVPAMASQCGRWETCMNRDPTKIGRTRVAAEMLAEVVNAFVEPITWKTLAFTLVTLGSLTLLVNALLSYYRTAPAQGPPALQTPYNYLPPSSGGFAPPHVAGYLAPPSGQSWGAWKQTDEAEELPARRRRLEDGAAAKVK
ncbi:hypothetical protein FISHEDRAFT_48740 [Fistulina hepatica ATCC 64428]|uniref:Brl1/Brr6 domain-containing protein n=1 Tax=Fistulina hepatica ATCC 64428 TaxID=1128425 RepID=A0A0D7A4F7_9AGAR|nr:hypothetical protein FISHEDRAFT_48740 [Fistulina hepatica ATCC 64428]